MRHFVSIVVLVCISISSQATQLGWASYFGGTSDEYGYSIATDPSGNVYIAGSATSTSHIATTGAHQTIYGGLGDAFLAKFNSSGTLQWATYFGGAGIEQANGVACDTAGNVYITGYTNSTSGIATGLAYQISKGGTGTNENAFLAKFSSSGSLLWSTYLGGSGNDEANGVACDISGNVYITGVAESTSGIATSNGYQQSIGGLQDVFVAKFNSGGQIQWATYYGGTYAEEGNAIACDIYGNVFVTGYTFSDSNISTTGAYQLVHTSTSDKDAFLARFDSSGALKWGTYFGGSLFDEGYSVACDTNGSVYMGGQTSSSGLLLTNSYQANIGGNVDGYIAKFDTSGTMQWGTYYGGAEK